MINAGERYDFVLNANQNVGNYWFRVRGDGDCFTNKVHQEAVLHYEGAAKRDPPGIPTYEDSIATGRVNGSFMTICIKFYVKQHLNGCVYFK